jgi:16S rRNA (uracil1498-N3)-methyltransferase
MESCRCRAKIQSNPHFVQDVQTDSGLHKKLVTTFAHKFHNMQLFYSSSIGDALLTLEEDDHFHCTRTLRSKPGDEIFVTDGNGKIYRSRIIEIRRNDTRCMILDENLHPKPSFAFAIAITPTKNPARLEWFVEKAVEVGISEIILYTSQRTEKKSVNEQRIKKIMLSAMKQSGNIYLPKLSILVDYPQLIQAITPKYSQIFIAHCEEKSVMLAQLHDQQKDAIVLIGPEGDFTTEEIQFALEKGAMPVSLGPSRLRTETAGLMSLMMLHYASSQK